MGAFFTFCCSFLLARSSTQLSMAQVYPAGLTPFCRVLPSWGGPSYTGRRFLALADRPLRRRPSITASTTLSPPHGGTTPPPLLGLPFRLASYLVSWAGRRQPHPAPAASLHVVGCCASTFFWGTSLRPRPPHLRFMRPLAVAFHHLPCVLPVFHLGDTSSLLGHLA
jgi:hypothetical protein